MNNRTFLSIMVLHLLLITVINLQGAGLYIHDKNSDNSAHPVQTAKDKNLDSYYSDKELGAIIDDNTTTFRLFAPSALGVNLYLFDDVNAEASGSKEMKMDDDGVWEVSVDGNLKGTYYGYKVKHDVAQSFENLPLCVDPYAKAVASYTTYKNPRKSIVFEEEYDWEGDEWIQRDWRDLIIYEMHIRDMTAHPSAGAKSPGTYKGLLEKNIPGGMDYIKNLGVNTVELLPPMDFGYCEIPYLDSLNGSFNTWNPYERNHWGYMTSNFFAPASYYAMDWQEFKWNEWMGADGSQVKQFKDMVKAFHKEGIGVMIDVVYNHLSEYEIGNLKQIDKEYYFRLDSNKNFIAQSGCGNDIRTEAPMMRRMIVESLIYWMEEYHVDGFRFDLGKLIDWETVEVIIRETRKVNPNVVIVCEPWGGGYDPAGFSLREWGSWNDQIRNGIKGENPNDGLGWIFGEWYGNNNVDRVKSYVNGTLVKYKHGLFQKKEHSVNYLESHDGYTLGDFIRIGTGEVGAKEVIKDVDKNAVLSERQLKLNKLGALFLFTSQGITMIHAGQEYARSKVIPHDIEVPDKHKGMLDHNSYEKDNDVNYINYQHAKLNSDLFDYYRGLIDLRKQYDAFRHADPNDIVFFDVTESEFALAYAVEYDDDTFLVLLNADQSGTETFTLPKGKWDVLVNEKKAGTAPLVSIEGSVEVKPVTGIVLKKN